MANNTFTPLSFGPDIHTNSSASFTDSPHTENTAHAAFTEEPDAQSSGSSDNSANPENPENADTPNDNPSGKPKKKKKKRGILGTLFRFFFSLAIIGGILGAGLAFAVYQWAAADLPSFSKITDYRPQLATTVLARDGSLIGQFYHERRVLIGLDDMAPTLPLAFLAIEDDSFYNHPGIDLKAIIRAALSNLKSGDTDQGASTITQQVVKRLMLTPEKTYTRKIKEMILALRLENQLSKNDILTIYLNQIFLGNNAYGVEAAAQVYFGKHAKDLTLAESAMIGGLPQSPTAYNPYRYPEAAKSRQRQVLRRMYTLGWISDSDYETALHEELVYTSMVQGMGPNAGWYLEEVRRQLLDMFSEENAAKNGLDFGIYGEDAVYELGLTVHTSMDPFQQEAGANALRTGLENATKRHGWRGPVEEVSPSEYETFLAKHPFKPAMLEKDGWVMALVEEVDKAGATVRLGTTNKGHVSVKTMNWARTPNKRVSGSLTGTAISDATKVVKKGDAIWVSLAPPAPPAKGQEPVLYDLSSVAAESVIPLRLQQVPDVQGALVSIEPQTGDVVALIGGYSFGSTGSQFNRATQAQRQPGSSFKPIVYSASLDNGFTPGSMLLDAPLLVINPWTKQAWRPRNFEGGFEGPIRLYRALARSRNLCTVRVAQEIGIDTVNERAKALGLEPYFPAELAVSLGAVAVSPINLTQAYTAFANQGQVSKPRLIQSIQGPWGNSVYENPPQHTKAISPQNAYIMASMLKGVVNFGTGGKAKVLNRPVAGKTGTTNDENDAWFLGFTPYLVTGVYIGYDILQPMGRGETGSGAALPIYVNYASVALDAYPPDDFPQPEGIVFSSVDGVSMPFIKGTEPGTGYGLNALGGGDGAGNENAEQGEDLLRQMF